MRLPAAERRQAILEAALRVFAEGSYGGATTSEIARAAEVSEPILYRHFTSKAELYRAVLEGAAQSLQAEFARARQEFQFGAGIRALLAVGRAQPDALRLLLVHAAREPEFADYAHDVRARVINRVFQRRRHDDPLFRRWAVEVARAVKRRCAVPECRAPRSIVSS